MHQRTYALGRSAAPYTHCLFVSAINMTTCLQDELVVLAPVGHDFSKHVQLQSWGKSCCVKARSELVTSPVCLALPTCYTHQA